MIQYYTPANDTDESVQEFYIKLQSTNPRNDNATILMGDLNAKIGSTNTGYEEIMGKCGVAR